MNRKTTTRNVTKYVTRATLPDYIVNDSLKDCQRY